jgi:hypothetical protein
VELKGRPHVSLTLRYPTRDVTRNLPAEDAADWVRDRLEKEFRSGLLGTTNRDWQYLHDKTGKARTVGHKPARTEPPPRAHDLPRQMVLDDTARDWLQGLGVMNNAGEVRPAMAGKYTQINRYLEIFSHLAKDCGWAAGTPELTLADMGCGKGYLTSGTCSSGSGACP